MRQWVCPGASPGTMVQQFLIPWLRGAYRHVYKGPWFPGKHARCTKPPLHLSPPPRPVYTEAMYEQTHASGGLGFLRPLPASVVWDICLYIGHVTENDGTHLCICNSIHDLKRLSTTSPIWRDAPRFTSLCVHDEQLTPEEFFAHLTAEVSANWDFMVESRSRPRPSQLHPHATGDTADEALGTRSADTIDVGDVSHAASVDVSEGPQPDAQQQLSRKLDVSYAPLIPLRDLSSSPLDVIHRLAVANGMDARAGEKYANIQQFVHAHRRAYASVRLPRAIDADKTLHNHTTNIVSNQDELTAVARQRDICTKRNEVETGARAATPAELRTIVPHEPYEADPGDAIRIDISDVSKPPAEYARYLAVKHGIVMS